MRYMVVIEEGENSFGAFVPDLPGCVAVAESEQEVRELIQEAISFHLEDLQHEGAPLPPPHCHSEFIEIPA
ncbi:MAG: type II toxin-antitoxin system HicB family antitoxin [Gammaproteobacteria bacterium]|nr:type II toxin-antitoxin system HicB family antitoxin [Gammaproteobacteria bacterium]